MMDLGPFFRCLLLAKRLPRLPSYAQPSERLLLLSALGRWRSLPASADPAQIDWPALLAVAHRFALIPMFAERSAQAPWAGGVPAAIREDLRERLERCLVQNRILFHDAVGVAAALTEAGVPHQLMKGMAILAYRHPDPVARQIDDIDVLIDARDLERVEAAMLSRGWTKRAIEYHATHPLIMDSPAGSMLEVHITLRTPFVEEVRRATRRVDIDGVALTVTEPEMLVRHLCHHAVRQHENDPRYLPRQLVDLQSFAAPRVRDVSAELCYEAMQLLQLAEHDPAVAHALGAVLFPTHHTALHRAMDNTRRSGFRGIRRELEGLARLPGYLMREIE